jgi:glycosyltransferase involved in cell wall biosynthesis
MSDSIHTARWINQLRGQGWDIHLFPSIDVEIVHPDLKNINVYYTFYGRHKNCDKSIRLHGIPVISDNMALFGRESLKRMAPNVRRFQLERTVRRLRPDIIQTMEIQAAGYLMLGVKERFSGKLPPWILTPWGSDIYLFGRLNEHRDKIKHVLAACDYYLCECKRDIQLAQEMGLRGEILPLLPAAGGFDLVQASQFRQCDPTSARRLILLKGYQGWAGRALVGLRAIALCADILRGYRVAVYLANDDVKIAAELVSKSTGVPIEIVPYCKHDDMMRLYGQSRISVSLSISDGVPNSLLESMVMGAFPIQSCTSCADEWIVDGETGLIVPPEDPEPIAAAIRRAVSDDALVDRAAELNAQVSRERLDEAVIQPQVIEMYEKIAAHASNKNRANI